MENQNDTTISQNGDKFTEIVNFIENKIINPDDGLTLAEVFQVLLQMFNGDLELVKKVLAHAKIMVKNGMQVAKESRLRKADVLRALEGLEGRESTVHLQHSMKTPLPSPVTTKKKGRGL
ncbi:hypothetical protein [Wolbachia endosymbiont of Ctenocephalides felis wCfeT]|uniref:hypothetical protein n=1 Tax=Wolbachia endosymbiont of Ctenocephalides felis wCfeT TaxID=2732593 RepID=UPI0015835E87|nr:hypothetical protein [Wolbachia endosymbiont of Ctenocephalides felis wCfeT]